MINWDHFTQSLLGTLVHSLWQSGLLFLLYRLAVALFQWHNPDARRNGLLFLLGIQCLISLTSFYLLYQGASFYLVDRNFTGILNTFTQDQSLLVLYNLAAIAYLLVLSGKLAYMMIGWYGFRQRISKDHQKPPVDIRLFTKAKAIELGIKRQVNIWLSEHIQSPMTFGYFKPVILLPVALLNHISMREAEALILHELSHIRRYDYLINWFILTMEQLYFFNPFTRSLIRQFRQEREMSCDAQVLDFRYPAVLYAEALLKTARLAHKPAIFHLPATGEQGELIRRISFFTSIDPTLTKKRSNPYRLLFLYLAGPLMLFLMSIAFNRQETKSKAGKSASITTSNNGIAYTTEPVAPVERKSTGIRVMYIDEATENAVRAVNKQSGENLMMENKGRAASANTAESRNTDPSLQTLYTPNYEVIQTAATEPVEVEEGKEFFIREEDPASGTIITKAYKVILKDGQWKNQFLWMTTETRPLADTLKAVCDSVLASQQ